MSSHVTLHNESAVLKSLPRWLLTPLPPSFLKPVLRRLMRTVVRKRPELFARLGVHKNKRYLIDPTNSPFVFLLCPNPDNPQLTAHRRPYSLPHDAQITSTFLTLLDMIDGRVDGDALFFSRDLIIQGDIEAVVVLRNAMDDLEGSIVDDLVSHFGFPAKLAHATLKKIGSSRHE